MCHSTFWTTSEEISDGNVIMIPFFPARSHTFFSFHCRSIVMALFITIAASMLLRSFCKYQFGTFEESGFVHDTLYPSHFVDGNTTVANRGCAEGSAEKDFCPLGIVYDRYAPTKQNLLCSGSSAFDVILSHANFQVISQLMI